MSEPESPAAKPPANVAGAASDSAASAKRDVVFVHSPTKDGNGARVLRLRDDTWSVGEVRALKEGAPIAGEVVKLAPREGAPRVCDVEVVYAPPAQPAAAASKGPPKVASAGYRAGWDAIFRASSFDDSN